MYLTLKYLSVTVTDMKRIKGINLLYSGTSGCTIFTASYGNSVLFGNNEDSDNLRTYIWFNPAIRTDSAGLGVVRVGYDAFIPEGAISFRPEVALTRLQLAELLLDRYHQESGEALEHLNFAITEFREMKIQPSLERAPGRQVTLNMLDRSSAA